MAHLNHKLPWNTLAQAYGFTKNHGQFGFDRCYNGEFKSRIENYPYGVVSVDVKKIQHFARVMEACLDDFAATLKTQPLVLLPNQGAATADWCPYRYNCELNDICDRALFEEDAFTGLQATKEDFSRVLDFYDGGQASPIGLKHTTRRAVGVFVYLNMFLTDETHFRQFISRAPNDIECAMGEQDGRFPDNFVDHFIELVDYRGWRDVEVKAIDQEQMKRIRTVNKMLFRRLVLHNLFCSQVGRPDKKPRRLGLHSGDSTN